MKEQMKENTAMIKAVRNNQLQQRRIHDAVRHEIAHIRGETATKRDITYIHERLDYQLGHIARTEEELHML
ncbi:putative membrane protein [Anoxybacillus eryuanensis]